MRTAPCEISIMLQMFIIYNICAYLTKGKQTLYLVFCSVAQKLAEKHMNDAKKLAEEKCCLQ
jgi:hypothetical protein